jgi:hypothetical protein
VKRFLTLGVLAGLAALAAAAAVATAEDHNPTAAKRVLLLSVDGLHQ